MAGTSKVFGLSTNTWVALGTVAAIVSTAAGIYFGLRSPDPAPRAANAPSSQPSQDLAFIRPPTGLIPRCALLQGTGAPPAGYTTFVALRNETASEYYIGSVTVDPANPGLWHGDFTVGTAADVHGRFVLYAFNVDAPTAATLNSMIRGESTLSALPAHQGKVATMPVTRNGVDAAPCR